jgi:malonyl-CoA O-methyltransferase
MASGPGGGVKGVFVTGTDTGIGKTLVSAVLARAWDADYWKPVQTGLADEAGDTATVAALAGLEPDRLHPPRHAYAAPLSPHAAAALEGCEIALGDFRLPAIDRPLVVEGAGGVLVPLNQHELMIDLIARLGLPAVVAARSTLGTINHTLLTLEALRARKIAILGVVLIGPPSPGNRAAIETFGQVRVLAEIPHLTEVDAAAVDALACAMPAISDLQRDD